MLKVFLNHASEDRALVMPYVEKLRALGHEPWIDRTLLPGQDWNEEIQRAFRSSDVVLIFMTPRSVRKRGYVQREIHDAMERLKFLLPGDIGVIPLMLEECDVPNHISNLLQYTRVPAEWNKVVSALALAAEQRSIAVNQGLNLGPFRVYLRQESNEWMGYPGYSIDFRLPHFESSILPQVAVELNEYMASQRLETALEARRAMVEQEPERFEHWGCEDDTSPSNSLELHVEPVLVSESILSFIAFEAGYFAGAAHGFHDTTTHNFVIQEDRLIKLMLEDFFEDPYLACEPFAQLCIKKINEEWHARYERTPDAEDQVEIEAAFPPKWDTYRRFSLNSNGMSISFPPYTLGGYAAGSWSVECSFEELKGMLKPNGPHLLAQKALTTSLLSEESIPHWEGE